MAFRLLITVQGFETSRYLGDTYSAPMRIRLMKYAQWVSNLVYVIYILLLAYVFAPGALEFSETAIIDLTQIFAPILPILLIIAALSAPFSAAIADTSGTGGPVEELTTQRLQPRHAYAALVGIGLVLTWTADVFQIIAYASRAFALFYGLQTGIADVTAAKGPGTNLASWRFAFLALSGMAIAIFSRAIGGG